MCVPAIGNAAKFAISPAAAIIGAMGKKKSTTPAQPAVSSGGSGY